MPHITLYQEKVARLKCIVTATIEDNGVFLMEGFDEGTLIDNVWISQGHEYSLKLSLEEVERLQIHLEVSNPEELLRRIQQQFGHKQAFAAFKLFLNQHQLDYEHTP
ncbi:MAG: hypothetical protein U0Y10_00180 [Spirosomataceae bacterium]